MDSLPTELIDRIWERLNYDDLTKTLVVSRQFQLASERACRQFEQFTLTTSNTEKFLKIYSGHRLSYLRHVEFQTSSPPLVWKDEPEFLDIPCRDTLEDLRVMDESLNHQISSLFVALKTIEDLTGKEHRLGRIDLTICTPTRIVEEVCIHRKYVCWRVHVLSPENLPDLFSIRSLHLLQNAEGQCYAEEVEDTPAKIDLRALLDLSIKLPNLECLGCKLVSDDFTTDIDSKSIRHYTRNWEGPQRDTRHDFAKALQDLTSKLPTSLKEVQLDFIDHFKLADGIDQRQPLPNLIKPALYDPFSSSLRLLSNQLRKLKLRAVVDETLFWPAEGNGPLWPNLEHLDVMFHMATPKGNWYFQGLQGDGRTSEGFEITAASYPPLGPNAEDERWDERADSFHGDSVDWSIAEGVQFRVVPDNEVLLPFLTGFAKVAANMPSLKKAALWSPLNFSPCDISDFYWDYYKRECDSYSNAPKLACGIIYAAPGERAFWEIRSNGEACGPEASLSDSHQIWWKVGTWRPDSDLHQLFQQIGCQDTRANLVEYWEDGEYVQRLVGREVFLHLAVFVDD